VEETSSKKAAEKGEMRERRREKDGGQIRQVDKSLKGFN
jgi:hypothetical protein